MFVTIAASWDDYGQGLPDKYVVVVPDEVWEKLKNLVCGVEEIFWSIPQEVVRLRAHFGEAYFLPYYEVNKLLLYVSDPDNTAYIPPDREAAFGISMPDLRVAWSKGILCAEFTRAGACRMFVEDDERRYEMADSVVAHLLTER